MNHALQGSLSLNQLSKGPPLCKSTCPASSRFSRPLFSLHLVVAIPRSNESPPGMPLDLTVPGMAVIKVRANSHGIAVLEEKLTSLRESGPERESSRCWTTMALSRGSYSAPPGHPSSISRSILWAKSPRHWRPRGPSDSCASTPSRASSTNSRCWISQARSDPFSTTTGRSRRRVHPAGLTRDAVRLAPVGEGVAVALRTGRTRSWPIASTAPDQVATREPGARWSSLGCRCLGIGITSGTFDTFGQFENHFHVHLDADAAGNIAVAVVGKPIVAPLFLAHADYFRQPNDVTSGVLVSRLRPDGQRLGTTLINTVQSSELHGLRLNGDDIALVGRVFSQKRADGSGWNAYTAHVDRTSGDLLSYRVVDLDRGELLLDIAPLGQGRFLVAGTAGTPRTPLVRVFPNRQRRWAVLESDGTLRQRIDIAARARARISFARSSRETATGWSAAWSTARYAFGRCQSRSHHSGRFRARARNRGALNFSTPRPLAEARQTLHRLWARALRPALRSAELSSMHIGDAALTSLGDGRVDHPGTAPIRRQSCWSRSCLKRLVISGRSDHVR